MLSKIIKILLKYSLPEILLSLSSIFKIKLLKKNRIGGGGGGVHGLVHKHLCKKMVVINTSTLRL